MNCRRGAPALLACVTLALSAVQAQQPARASKPPIQRDTAAKPDVTEADSSKDDADEPERSITTGISAGGLNYAGGRSERATSAIIRWRVLPWLSVGATPTVARTSVPNVVAQRPAVTRNGLTDLPIEIGADHSFDFPGSPGVSLGMGVTLPVGDTASGFGSGSVGTSISLGGSLAFSDNVGVHASVGRSLSDFSVQSTFTGTSTEFGDFGVSLHALDHLSLSAGIDGDIGASDPNYGRAASVSGGVSVAIPYLNSVSLNGSRGISGATPTWSFVIGVGTDFASLGSVNVASAASRLRRGFGGGTHGLAAKGAKTVPSGRRKQP